MKVYAISDLHLSINNPKPMDIFGEVWNNYLEDIEASWSKTVNDDDIVLIAGDISWAMNLDGVVPDLEYLGGFKGKKVLLRGNHDYWWHSISAVRKLLPENMYAVQNDCIRFNNVLIGGSRLWTTPEKDFATAEDKKIYDRELIRIKLSLDSMKKIRKEGDVVIFMTHFPPFNSRLAKSPFTELFTKYKVDCVVYGHLHGKGIRVVPTAEIDGVKYVLSSCDLVDNTLVEIL
ncbi:MAG: serine/threonine protein phosphatase [Clostridiales bacterium]|nr:serine/threonine protein phosphatase [Clostridiales bacterium]